MKVNIELTNFYSLNILNLKSSLLSTSRLNKQLIAALADFISVLLSTFIAIELSKVSYDQLNMNETARLLWMPFFSIFIFYIFGVYRTVLRYIDFSLIFLLLKAIITVFLVTVTARYLLIDILGLILISNDELLVSLQGWLIGCLMSIILIIGSRITANHFLSDNISSSKVAIYGAGSAGIQLAGALTVSSEMQPVAYIDDDLALQNTIIGGLKVYGLENLEFLINKKRVNEVLIAMPSVSRGKLKNILRHIELLSVKVRILPGLAELAQGKVLVSDLKSIEISDLLGRSEAEPNQDLIDKNIKDKVVLVTGAGGSIGSEISKQVIRNNPSKIILFDSNEFALYQINEDLILENDRPNIYPILGNITNKKRMKEICRVFKVDTIYHAAAYKHVPLVEENPFEGAFNNVIGTKICAEAAAESGVETFVLVSTDKAVRPTNIMGATKRFAELILQSFSESHKNFNQIKMIMVRFGNVVGSSGSAIPLFQQQIEEGGPVTVTDPEVTRYFMSIPEAAELVIQAGALGQGGDVFVLDMGEPLKIYELAKKLIKLSGMEVKDENNLEGDIEIIFTGLRPGEKLYEELLIGNNVSATEHKQIFRAKEDFLPLEELSMHLEALEEAEKKGDVSSLIAILKQVVSGFTPAEEIGDIVYRQNH